MAAAVDRRVMVETPDLKADFAVNLPRTGALRNRGKLASPRGNPAVHAARSGGDAWENLL
jgi:hypothetical protein